MMRYVTYGTLLLIVVAAAAGFASAVDPAACSPYATYSYSAGDCVYVSSYYNQMAIQWRNSNPYASQYANPWSKYQNWYDSSGYYHAYDTAPANTGYYYYGKYYGGYAAYESVYGPGNSAPDGGTHYGGGYNYAPISAAQSNTYASSASSGYSNYVSNSYNTNNYYNYGTGSSGSSGYNYGSSGCSYSYYGCSGYNYGGYGYSNPYSYSYGYAYGSSPSVYYAFWSSH